MKIIGLDAHSATFTMAVQNDRGKLMRCFSRRTSEEELIAEVGKVSGEKWLVVEESHLAQWVYVTLKPYVDQLTVCDPRQNRWIAEDDFADDHSSAKKLAELARMGKLKPVYHPDDGIMAELRSLFLHYHRLNVQLTRAKNQLKATYRQVALPTAGAGIYDPSGREQWLDKLKPYAHLTPQAKHMFELVDAYAEMKQDTHRRMLSRSRRVPAFGLLTAMPGVGDVIASGYLAIIITPHRFSRKNKLWRYACLGNVHHESDNVVYKKRASRSGNRVLKWLVRQHFQAAVVRSKQSNRFKRQYDTLMQNGLGKRDARRQVCRSLLSVVRAIWIQGEAYRDEPLS